MFTVYNHRTGKVRCTVTHADRESAYAQAERICNRIGGGNTLVFDDTCDHGTAYDLCGICGAEVGAA